MQNYLDKILQFEPVKRSGKVLQYLGLVIEASGPDAQVGEFCHVFPRNASKPVLAEVVGFKQDRLLLMPFGRVSGISVGSEVIATGKLARVPVGPALLGRVIDAFCSPLDQGPTLQADTFSPLYREPINPLQRAPITEVIETGIKAIDSCLTLGKGQRMGVFSGSGVGKSTLLGMLAKNVNADVNVIALIGERGREVLDFIQDALGEEGLAKSILVVATADQPALVRTHAAYTATAIAEYFAHQGQDVLLMMDSITRFAMAQREIGLAIGEPPTTRGYTPSVFSQLPAIVERCGNFTDAGSITALYTVLVEGDDFNEPITDSMRAVLDGHIMLTRELANAGHYPAIDVLTSKSRLIQQLTSLPQQKQVRELIKTLSDYQNAKDLIEVGAYEKGKNSMLDQTIAQVPLINQFLQQTKNTCFTTQESLHALQNLVSVSGDTPS
ncbi:MAG: FliI/YscN family ATPase [Pseudomonadota bacterium]